MIIICAIALALCFVGLIISGWMWFRNDYVYAYRIAIIKYDSKLDKSAIKSGNFDDSGRLKNYKALPSYHKMWASPRKWPIKRLKKLENDLCPDCLEGECI